MYRMQDCSAWIQRFADLVPVGGNILDLASGGGRHSRFFLDRGHPVTAIDHDVSGLDILASRKNLEIIQYDLEDGSPWPLASRQFAAVVVVNYLHRALLTQLVASVASGGLLLYDTFAMGNEALGRPSNPDFLLRPGELADCVRDELTIVDYFHGSMETPKPAIKQQICARRES